MIFFYTNLTCHVKYLNYKKKLKKTLHFTVVISYILLSLFISSNFCCNLQILHMKNLNKDWRKNYVVYQHRKSVEYAASFFSQRFIVLAHSTSCPRKFHQAYVQDLQPSTCRYTFGGSYRSQPWAYSRIYIELSQ